MAAGYVFKAARLLHAKELHDAFVDEFAESEAS
jgi:hypothetical protein